jgi:hypothetical protein
MAQTSTTVSGVIAKIQISADLATWTEISGSSQSVQSTDQERASNEAYTLDGDTAIIATGKRQPIDLEFNIVYTATATEAYELARAIFENATTGSKVYVRWTPSGGTDATAPMYRTPITGSPAFVTMFRYPPVDAAAPGPVMGMFRVRTPLVEKTTAGNTSGGSGT